MKNGFAVPLVLVFLIMLALLGGTATLLTTRDLQVAGLYSGGHRAFQASSSALDQAVLVFETHGPEARRWPVRGNVDGFGYRVHIARDTFDFGGGPAPVSIDERTPGSIYNGDDRGDPVYVLTATALRGLARSVQLRWLASNSIPRLPGALTIHTQGAVELSGAGRLSGLNVTAAGAAVDPSSRATAGSCGENRSALHVAGPGVAPPVIGITTDGNPAYSGSAPPYVTLGSGAEWSSPEDVLRVGRGALDYSKRSGFLHGMAPPQSLSGVTWITDDVGGPNSCLTRGGCANLEGEGILIVHNPRYDPRQHDPTDPRYDPVIAASPAHQPAVLHDISGGHFRGIVIVDALPSRPSGGFSITGGIAELSRSSATRRLEWRSNTSIEYSCETVRNAARDARLGTRLLAWKG